MRLSMESAHPCSMTHSSYLQFCIDGREVAGTLGDMIAEGEDEEHKTDEERRSPRGGGDGGGGLWGHLFNGVVSSQRYLNL